MQKDLVVLSTTHQKTPRMTTQPRVMNIYNGDNYELVHLFDEVIYVQKPWRSTTLGYNLPKTNASTTITTFVGFQNQPPRTNIHLVPINSKMERLHLLNKLEQLHHII